MKIEISVLFNVAIALIGVYATFNKISRDTKKDREERERNIEENREKQTERHVEIKMGIDNINSVLREAVLDIKAMDTRIDSVDKRVTINEESIKSAHKRIDRVEKKCDIVHRVEE